MNKKKISIQLFALGLLTIIATSCYNENFAEPVKTNYAVDTTLIGHRISIADLKLLHTGGADSLTYIDTAIYLKTTVIANDESGNYYKKMVVQDSTGGIEINVNGTGLHNIYPEGQLLYIKCKGLYLGAYGGVVSLGADYKGSIGRIEEPLLANYLLKADGGKPIQPRTLLITQLTDVYVNTLVKIENAQFKTSELGNTFADGIYLSTSDISLQDCDKNVAVVRTSGYANFAGQLLPEGNGDITAVFSLYKTTKQLYVRRSEELNFAKARCGAWFEEDFGQNLGDFIPFSILGDKMGWTQASKGGNTYANITGYYSPGREESDDWLVSPAINLSGKTGAKLKFRHAAGYFSGALLTDMEVYVSSTYDGVATPNADNGIWTLLSGYVKPDISSAGTYWAWVSSGDIDLSAMDNQSKVYVAFRYRSTASKALTWEVTNVEVSVNP